MNFAQEIKDRIGTREAFEFYGLKVNSKGFVCCPFHKEKTPSLRVYDGQRGYYCFGCGASGDIITFVKNYFGVSFGDAIKKINEDFSLALPIGQKINNRKRLELAKDSFIRKREISEEKKKYQELKNKYWSAYDSWLRLDQNRLKYAPKTEADEFHPLYIEAVHGIELALHRIEEAETEIFEYEHRNG